jgi:hypothetical protein
MVVLSNLISMCLSFGVFYVPLVMLASMLDGSFFRVQMNYNFWVLHAVVLLLAWNTSLFSILACISHDYKATFGCFISLVGCLLLSLISGLGSTIITLTSTPAALEKLCRASGKASDLCDQVARGERAPGAFLKVAMTVPLVFYWICTVWAILLGRRYVQVLKKEKEEAAAKAAAKKGGSRA